MMTTLITVAVPLITFVLMISVGFDLTVGRLGLVWRRPALILAGLLGPVVLLPPLALGVVALVEPGPLTTAGLLLVAACPIGGLSNFYSLLARAATALSVTLTALSCVAAAVTIPTIALGIETLHGVSLAREAPVGALAGQLMLWLALPVSLGMAIRHYAPAVADRWQHRLQRAGFVLLGALIAAILATSDLRAHDLGEMTFVAALFIVGSFALGWASGLPARADAAASFTLGAEFATRNLGVAALLAVTLLGRVEFAVFGAIYLLTEIPLAMLAIAAFARRDRRERAAPASELGQTDQTS